MSTPYCATHPAGGATGGAHQRGNQVSAAVCGDCGADQKAGALWRAGAAPLRPAKAQAKEWRLRMKPPPCAAAMVAKCRAPLDNDARRVPLADTPTAPESRRRRR